MKLHELERGALFRLVRTRGDGDHPPAHRDFQQGEILRFGHIDGMYSLCWDTEGHAVHVVAWAEVKEVDQ